MTTAPRLRELVEPIVAERGLELYDLHFGRGVLAVTIDRPDHTAGVGIDDIAGVSRAISRALDEHDPIPDHYSLEVSSPGLERPLRTPDHYRRARGERVSLKMVPAHVGDRRIVGTVVDADEQAVVLEVEPGQPALTLRYDEIDKARTVFEWGPEPRPSGPGSKGARTKAARAKTGGSRPTADEPSPAEPATGAAATPNDTNRDKKVSTR